MCVGSPDIPKPVAPPAPAPPPPQPIEKAEKVQAAAGLRSKLLTEGGSLQTLLSKMKIPLNVPTNKGGVQ